MKLTAVIIAKDEEEMIADVITSCDFADEIIVVDNGSADRTVEIAKYLKAKVFSYETTDFSKLRNFGLEKASGDWVLYVDADERVTQELKNDLRSKIYDLRFKNFGAFKIKRKNFYLGNHEWPYVEKIERLFKKEALKGWQGKLHESPVVNGEIGELEGFLLHYTHRDLTSMLKKTIEWSEVEAELRFKTNHPKIFWWRFPRVMLTAFFDSYIHQGGWKVGTIGFLESIYQSFSAFITYARLWELQQEK